MLLTSYTLPFFSLTIRPPPCSTLFPYTTLFRSELTHIRNRDILIQSVASAIGAAITYVAYMLLWFGNDDNSRSEEHTSELQSHSDLVCRLLLEKKKGEA